MESHDDNGVKRVFINPGPGYIIRASDSAFILAESYSDACSIWKFVGQVFTDDETGKAVSRVSCVKRFVLFRNRNQEQGTTHTLFVHASPCLCVLRCEHLICPDMKKNGKKKFRQR